MDLDSNFTALLIAIVVISLLVGLAIYYNISHFKNVQSLSQNSLGMPNDRSIPLSQGGKDLGGRIYKTQFTFDKSQFKMAPEFAGVTGNIIPPLLNWLT